MERLGRRSVKLARASGMRALAHPDVRASDPNCPAETGDLAIGKNGRMALQRMDNVGIVVASSACDAAIAFAELGLELEGAGHDRSRLLGAGHWTATTGGVRS